jgi:hypothetical protein
MTAKTFSKSVSLSADSPFLRHFTACLLLTHIAWSSGLQENLVLGLLKLIQHASLQTARETAVSSCLNPKPNINPLSPKWCEKVWALAICCCNDELLKVYAVGLNP